MWEKAYKQETKSGENNNPTAQETITNIGGNTEREVIVVVQDEGSIEAIISRANDLGGVIHDELRGIINGFTASMTDSAINILRGYSEVNYIEVNSGVQKQSATFRDVTKITTSSLSSIDDGNSPSLELPFPLVWFGTLYRYIVVNSNGGAILKDVPDGARATSQSEGYPGFDSFFGYENIDLRTAEYPYILPLYTDLDPSSNGTVEFGTGYIDGFSKQVFWAEWIDVAEYGNPSARQEFQMLIIEESDGARVEFRYVDLTNAGSTTNDVFEVGISDPNNSNNTVRITDDNGDPSASELLSGQNGGSTGVWSLEVLDPGGAIPAPQGYWAPVPSSNHGEFWHLDRINQRSQQLDNNSTNNHDGGGAGVTIYVLDTGIRQTHTEYASRVVAGYDFVDNDNNPSDCDGHGTLLAGLAAGSNDSVAPLANVSGIRVLDCYGSGSTSNLIAGMNWVLSNHSSGDAVVLVSMAAIGGNVSKSIDDAITALTSAGITVVVPAGNSSLDAQNTSPARVSSAITVGATTSSDARAYFSNYGSSVDIFAPGIDVYSSWYTSNSDYTKLNGTSVAAAQVAGAAALYLSLNPGSTPEQVSDALISAATTDVITDAGSGSPNRLLYVARPDIAITSDVSTLSAGETATLTFTLSDPSTDFIESDVSVSGGFLSDWNPVSSTSYTATFTPAANSTDDGLISVATGGFSNSWGNTNADGSDSNNSITLTIDSIRPIIITDLEAYNYIASYGDLINAFGTDIEAAKSHYENYGISEGRSLTGFSTTNYLTKYGDLSAAFGNDQILALKHFINNGFNEGRTDNPSSGSSDYGSSSNLTDIEALNYIASYGDLINAFGIDIEAAKSHYINHGQAEGRAIDNFDEWQYLASYSDLINAFGSDTTAAIQHYIANGYTEERSKDSFDEWGYLASNNDLIKAFGSDTTEAIKHYISYGIKEGRGTDGFNAESYLNNYADLQSAFGNDHDLAKKHFIEHGFAEGRVF